MTRTIKAVSAMALAFAILPAMVLADQRVVLKSGLALQGLLAEIPSLDKKAFAQGSRGSNAARPILMVDDGLRRVYVHRRGMVAGPPKDVRGVEQTIELKQLLPLGGSPSRE